jgi:hypothetical protein
MRTFYILLLILNSVEAVSKLPQLSTQINSFNCRTKSDEITVLKHGMCVTFNLLLKNGNSCKKVSCGKREGRAERGEESELHDIKF